MDNITLIKGDCIDVMQDLISKNIKVDLTVTSPPYDNLRSYKNTCEWNFDIFKKVAQCLYDITKDGGMFKCEELEKAWEWDGHTPKEAADRLKEYIFNY